MTCIPPIYLYDLGFVVFYVLLKRLLKWMKRRDADSYEQNRKRIAWMEFSLVLLGVYLMPPHTGSEKAVAFFMGLLTKLGFDGLMEIIRWYKEVRKVRVR